MQTIDIWGFRRGNGSLGIRNHLLILATVVCANRTVQLLAEEIPVAVPVIHQCGCVQLGQDLEQTYRTLKGTALNPNVGAVILVGLGCETINTKELMNEIKEQGQTVESLIIREENGIENTIKKGRKIAGRLLEKLDKDHRQLGAPQDLCIGVECGGSDYTSGLVANPVVGSFVDSMIEQGSIVIVSELTEFIGAEQTLAERTKSPGVFFCLQKKIKEIEDEMIKMGYDFRGAQPTPGNIKGGLTTIEEKSLGCIYKAGSKTIQEVVDYAYKPEEPGLVIMDTPGHDVESLTGMTAGGAQLIVFTTGGGTPVGSPVAPVVKITANVETQKDFSDHIDFSIDMFCSFSFDEKASSLYRFVEKVINGTLTTAEKYKQYDFAISRLMRSL